MGIAHKSCEGEHGDVGEAAGSASARPLEQGNSREAMYGKERRGVGVKKYAWALTDLMVRTTWLETTETEYHIGRDGVL